MSFPVPQSVDPILAEYLQRAFNDIENRMNRTPVLAEFPVQPYEGQVVYLKKAGQEGFYGYGIKGGVLKWEPL